MSRQHRGNLIPRGLQTASLPATSQNAGAPSPFLCPLPQILGASCDSCPRHFFWILHPLILRVKRGISLRGWGGPSKANYFHCLSCSLIESVELKSAMDIEPEDVRSRRKSGILASCSCLTGEESEMTGGRPSSFSEPGAI